MTAPHAGLCHYCAGRTHPRCCVCGAAKPDDAPPLREGTVHKSRTGDLWVLVAYTSDSCRQEGARRHVEWAWCDQQDQSVSQTMYEHQLQELPCQTCAVQAGATI